MTIMDRPILYFLFCLFLLLCFITVLADGRDSDADGLDDRIDQDDDNDGVLDIDDIDDDNDAIPDDEDYDWPGHDEM